MTSTETSRPSVQDIGEFLDVSPSRLVIAGYTARDQSAVRAHIHELERIGVPPPPTGPMFYEIPTLLAISAPSILVDGDRTSGEAERVHQKLNGRRAAARCR